MDKLEISYDLNNENIDPEKILVEYLSISKKIHSIIIDVNKHLKKKNFLKAFSHTKILEDLYKKISFLSKKLPKNYKIKNQDYKSEFENLSQKLDIVLKENIKEIQIESDLSRVTTEYLKKILKNKHDREQNYDHNGQIRKPSTFKSDISLGVKDSV